VKVTNLDTTNGRCVPNHQQHPKRKLPQQEIPVNTVADISINLEIVTEEVTVQMRSNYDKFWQLLIGRLLDIDPDP
jgi:hypothetical protein